MNFLFGFESRFRPCQKVTDFRDGTLGVVASFVYDSLRGVVQMNLNSMFIMVWGIVCLMKAEFTILGKVVTWQAVYTANDTGSQAD